ncbi:MAG: endonuclease III [Clostridia bacterium]|nr:endonuclease III [Clostridia bacterium]MBQ2939245.1 endonuclease III [Clostridia bacterium]
MTKKQRAVAAVERLKAAYPEAICSLNYSSAWQLLVATRLSAQCTDARVNLVTPALFAKYPTMVEMAAADVEEVGKLIYSCGFYKTKSADLVEMSRILCETYGGIIPDTVEELIKLPGVGRKTANLVVGDVYGKPAVVTDTHCIRITNRLGLTDSDVPVKVESQLRAILPPEESNDFCHRLVLFGRDTCSARSPKCEACPLSDICKNKAKK